MIEIKDIELEEDIIADEGITHLVDDIEFGIHLMEVILVLSFSQDLVDLDTFIGRKIIGLGIGIHDILASLSAADTAFSDRR